MTLTLRDLMEANDEEPDQHVRETFVVEDANGIEVEIDIIGHYDGPAHQQPELTTVRVWDPTTAQPFIDRPYDPELLVFNWPIEDYPQVPAMVNATIEKIQTDGVDALGDDDE